MKLACLLHICVFVVSITARIDEHKYIYYPTCLKLRVYLVKLLVFPFSAVEFRSSCQEREDVVMKNYKHAFIPAVPPAKY